MKHMIMRVFAAMLALMLAMGAALADSPGTPAGDSQTSDAQTDESRTIEDALQQEEDDLSIYYEEKVRVEPSELAVNEELDDSWTNILLAGSDTRVSGSYGRTDALLILSINAAEKQAKLTSIMRDIWTPMHGRGPQKISAANVFGGPTLTMRTINEDFGMNIVDYVLVDMAGVENMIDMIGGLELDITEDEMWGLNASWNRDATALITPVTTYGENVHLTGEQALAYARLRSIDNDYRRTARQRAVLLAIARKAAQVSSGEMLTLIRESMRSVETSLSMTEVIQLAVLATQLDLENVEQFRIPAEGTYTDGYEDKLWVMWPDFDANTKQLHAFIYGSD